MSADSRNPLPGSVRTCHCLDYLYSKDGSSTYPLSEPGFAAVRIRTLRRPRLLFDESIPKP
jgi:hypothetical protein